MEEFRTPLSRAEAILENILGAENELQDPLSNVEEILLSILNDTPYTKEPETLIEEMLLAIKEGTEMDAIAKNRVEEILLAIIHGEEYTKLPLSRFEELLIEWLKESAVTEKFLDFAPILSFSDSAGKPLVECKVKVEPVQDLHGYDSPWPAGGGKNKLDIDALINAEGGYFPSSTYYFKHLLVLTLKPSTFYTLSTSFDGATNVIYFNNSTAASAVHKNNPVTVSTDENGIIRVGLFDRTGIEEFEAKAVTVQLEEGSTATAYAPYENICPISGHTKVNVVRAGKNLFDSSILVEKVAWQYIDLPLKEGTYTFSCTLPTNTAEFAFYFKKEGSSAGSIARVYLGHPVTITLNEGENAEVQYRRVSGTGVFSDYTYQLELGSTATDYEPYQGETYTIQLGDTIYGGERDVTTGKLTANLAMVDLGTLNWTARISGEQNRLYSSPLPQAYVPSYSLLRGWICDTYAENSPSSVALLRQDIDSQNIGLYSFRSTAASTTTLYLIVPKTASPTGKLVYELATPIEIQLTPTQITTLLGNNTLYADTGDISVKYLAKKS